MNTLYPSILSADFGRLRDQIRAMIAGGAHGVHFDVMDGHFVPEISFGEPLLRSVRTMTDAPLDVHLMVTNPADHIEAIRKAGADFFTFHYEVLQGGAGAYGGEEDPAAAQAEAKALIDQIHAAGMKAGISIKPRTPVEVLFPLMGRVDLILVMSVEPGFGGQAYMPESTDRIRALREEADRVSPGLHIEVDGGVKTDNVRMILDAGADMIVAGSAVLGGDDAEDKARAFLEIMN